MNTASSAAAGLGLFFVGMRLVGSHLQQLASGLAHKMMHGTLRALHEAEDAPQRDELSRAASRLWLRHEAPAGREAA